jgi:hypothetical protein
MQLKIHSDASYLSEPKAKSIIGGYFYLKKKQTHPRNSSLMVHLLKHVVLSVAEAVPFCECERRHHHTHNTG